MNLIGDHTDYNEGFVLPAAIDLECVVAARRREDAEIALRALDEVEEGWHRYPQGVAAALAERGRPPVGIDGALASSVPPGSGLSSSAALEVACALALCDAAGFELGGTELALACQRGEHLASGVRSGVMDQLAAVAGQAGHALLIDCRSLEIRPVAVPEELALLVVHSGLPRRLEQSAYAERLAACERIARSLGLRSLRDAAPADVRDEPLARHVVGENARVLAAAVALERGDVSRLGTLFLESHASLRDDYRVSTPELDVLVDALVAAGAAGARLTGAGFGGCVVAVAERPRAAGVLDRAAASYAAATGRTPTVRVCEPSRGASQLGRPSAIP
ncbi:MAG: galactokinase [Thermoleophilia bacterium]|nr:galactokinase [Thermoleophilia bacterium]